jgi:hypothetical protein
MKRKDQVPPRDGRSFSVAPDGLVSFNNGEPSVKTLRYCQINPESLRRQTLLCVNLKTAPSIDEMASSPITRSASALGYGATRLGPRRLTAFQSLMREWSALAPYNFIHAMRLSAPAELDRWRNSVAEAMQALTILPAAIPIEQPATDLESHLEAELHRPFSPLAVPLRFFVVDARTGGHWFGVVVDHWLADDFSCRMVLQRIYSIYHADLTDPYRSHLEWMGALPSQRSRWREWRSLLRQAVRLRRACRTSLRDPMDFNVRTFGIVLPEGTLEASQKLAKEHGATLHDVFLAATAQAFGAARRWETGTRRDAVAIASAMDLRRFESDPQGSGFGLLLSQYVVMEQRPHEVSLSELSKRIAAQTRRMKAVPGTDLFAPALSLWRLSRSRRAKATLFPRSAPLVAGLSNVNLTGSWIEQSGLMEYRRIGPTGPIVPMVLMITTLRGRIFMDVTFRTAAFTPAEAERLIGDIIHRLPSRAS